MRVLVTGSNGLLGTKLLELLLADAGVEPLAVSRAPCANSYLGAFRFWRADLAAPDAAERLLDQTGPRVVLHTAAMTDVDGCEREPEAAWRANVEATRALAAAASRHRARVVHLSTEYVFDGTAGPYSERDPPNPLSVYGRTKLASEQVLRETLSDSVVARTTVVFGHAAGARPNFVTWLLRQLSAGQPVRLVSDQVGSPTLADNLAHMVWSLGADPAASGIYNTVGASVVDRLSFARTAAEVFHLDGSLLVPTDTRSLNQLAPRPLRAGLRMDKFAARYPDVPILTVEEALRRLRHQLANPDPAGGAGIPAMLELL